MTKKIFTLLLFVFIVMFMTGFVGLNKVSALESYPAGCSSALGYSATTGLPCNGSTNNAIKGFMPGCTNALGYSASTGLPCSGGREALLQYLAGCSSVIGYSMFSGLPCNGTNVATTTNIITPTPTTPGLPLTGAGGNAPFNTYALIASGALAFLGAIYLIGKSKLLTNQ